MRKVHTRDGSDIGNNRRSIFVIDPDSVGDVNARDGVVRNEVWWVNRPKALST